MNPLCVAAWGGPLPKWLFEISKRSLVWVKSRRSGTLRCFGTTKDGSPRHPLMLAYDTPLVNWPRRTLPSSKTEAAP
jgi:hypothetical protein